MEDDEWKMEDDGDKQGGRVEYAALVIPLCAALSRGERLVQNSSEHLHDELCFKFGVVHDFHWIF